MEFRGFKGFRDFMVDFYESRGFTGFRGFRV